MKIAWYASGHGFGHISRSSVVINRILELYPASQIVVTSSRGGFLGSRDRLETRIRETDPGMFQKTSIDLDLEKTLANIENFLHDHKTRLEEERIFLQQYQADVVVSDASSWPLKLAQELGIRSIFMGNFTWDFIYSYYAKYNPLFQQFASSLALEYACADKQLILPFHCVTERNARQIFTGVIGRKPTRSKIENRNRLGFAADKIYILLSFGAYGLQGIPFELEKLDKNIVLVASELDFAQGEQILHMNNEWYPDLVSACDYVLTKPGYGILSECHFARTPVIYTERGDFPEYPFLVGALQTHFASHYIEKEDLLQMNFSKIFQDKKQWPQKKLDDGLDQVVAEIVTASPATW